MTSFYQVSASKLSDISLFALVTFPHVKQNLVGESSLRFYSPLGKDFVYAVGDTKYIAVQCSTESVPAISDLTLLHKNLATARDFSVL